MVKRGTFTVELVDAVTKEPFKEHIAPDGETYVEVEPEAEYFIRVQQQTGQTNKYKFYVDGKHLGYSKDISSSKPFLGGIWALCDGIGTNTALKFARTYVKNEAETTALWTGKVEVRIYKAVFSHTEDRSDFSSDFKKGDVGYVRRVSDKNQSKGVQSVEGTTAETVIHSNKVDRYKKGNRIETFKLNYCTAPGLINAGILPKPPLMEYARMVKPFKRENSEGGKELDIKPEKIRIEGVKGIGAGDYEMFDLSQLSDSDSNKTYISMDSM